MPEVDAGPADAEPSEEVRAVRAGNAFVALAQVDGDWFAFADACTHDECPLADGFVEGATIECACHGSIFDVRSGAVLRGPATAPIRIYPASVRDGRVVVDVAPLDPGGTVTPASP